MKKILCSAAIICILAALISCKSTKAGKKAASEVESTPVAEEIADGAAPAEASVAETKKGKKAKAKKEKKSKKDKQAEEQKAAAETPESKDYTGWIKASKKKINERFGKVQLRVKPGIGTYTIAVLNEKEKPVPVLSTSNEFVANAFYLKTPKKIYNLVTDSTVKSSGRATADGAILIYDIPSVAQVTVFFSCFPSEKKKDTDMVKITAAVKNMSNRNDDFSFKAVLDTVLGESGAFHYYTYEEIPVKCETLYRTLQNQKWFVSRNLNAYMQLFFTGADCTPPDILALANYSTLESKSWEPDMLSYRVFDTVLSYNNSAVCAIWKPVNLAPSETAKFTFYIAVSGNGTPATGEKYIYSKEFQEAEEAEKAAAARKAATSALEVITPGGEDNTASIIPAESPAPVQELTSNPVPETGSKMTTDELPSVDFYIQNMTKEQLSPEYIQNLLDRIAALEEDSPSLNRQELLQLNAELDAILTYLRQ